MKDDNLLSCLLDVAEAELEVLNNSDSSVKNGTPKSSFKNSLSEIDLFNVKNDESEGGKKESSLIHTGDTDSSDDEGKRNFEDQKYNNYGKDIKSILSHVATGSSKSLSGNSQKRTSSWTKKPTGTQPSSTLTKFKNVYTDSIFGLSISNPLISSKVFEERMAGRKPVQIYRIQNAIRTLQKDEDWVVAGVLCGKGLTKTTSKGDQFIIWTLSDLLGDIKTIAVFLFGSAYSEFWKTQPGSVVGILNPTIFDKKEGSRDEASLSVSNSQKVMILGESRDLGVCKAIKNNGGQCTAIVNKNKCEYCIYHVKQEYQKCSQRSDLQANFSGKGLVALRNKVLGKNEVFYAGKSYTAIPAKQSKKLLNKDKNRLQSLNSKTRDTSIIKQKTPVAKAATSFDVVKSQRLKDMETLKKLGVNVEQNGFKASQSRTPAVDDCKANALKILSKLKEKDSSTEVAQESSNSELQKSLDEIVDKDLSVLKTRPAETQEKTFSNALMSIAQPSLSKTDFIDFSNPIPRRTDKAKLKALQFIQKHGPIKKTDPNDIKGVGIKRNLEECETENAKKLRKITENEFLSDRFKKMMEIQSKHMDLVEQRDEEEKEKYFKKLEARERMEEKMATTYKIECKAVRCLTCKYTNFSAAERCKQEKHRLKVFDAVKRFFKCGNCGNRVVALDIVPTHACKNCGSGKWERTTMMKEKIVTNMVNLSIRGGEQKFVNSVVTESNLNLLVPDDN